MVGVDFNLPALLSSSGALLSGVVPAREAIAAADRFISPHGLAIGNGALYVSEWLLGGRWTRTPLGRPAFS